MTPSRFLVVAMPPPLVLEDLKSVLDAIGLRTQLQGAMFDPANWHQSLTVPVYEQSEVERLWRACAQVRASACTVALTRIRGLRFAHTVSDPFRGPSTKSCWLKGMPSTATLLTT